MAHESFQTRVFVTTHGNKADISQVVRLFEGINPEHYPYFAAKMTEFMGSKELDVVTTQVWFMFYTTFEEYEAAKVVPHHSVFFDSTAETKQAVAGHGWLLRLGQDDAPEFENEDADDVSAKETSNEHRG